MTSLSSKHLTTCTMASVIRIFVKNLFPRPAPSLAPYILSYHLKFIIYDNKILTLTIPAISTNSIVAGTTFSDLFISPSFSSL